MLAGARDGSPCWVICSGRAGDKVYFLTWWPLQIAVNCLQEGKSAPLRRWPVEVQQNKSQCTIRGDTSAPWGARKEREGTRWPRTTAGSLIAVRVWRCNILDDHGSTVYPQVSHADLIAPSSPIWTSSQLKTPLSAVWLHSGSSLRAWSLTIEYTDRLGCSQDWTNFRQRLVLTSYTSLQLFRLACTFGGTDVRPAEQRAPLLITLIPTEGNTDHQEDEQLHLWHDYVAFLKNPSHESRTCPIVH